MNQIEIERMLTTRFSRALLAPFTRALRDYRMIAPGDRIAVCISGGKDSMLLAKLLQNYQRHMDFSLVYLAMDPGYAPENRAHIEENARTLGLPVEFFETNVLRVAANHAAEHPCFLCAKMRRGHLYAEAQKRGCNKIALGHHYDDAIETVLMGLLYGGQVQAMLPRLQSKNYPGMELIRPLYHVQEADVLAWAEACGLTFLPCGCPASTRKEDTKRAQIKALIASLAADNPQIKSNILNAVKNVDVSKVLGWREGNSEKHSFVNKFPD
ncbi:MAG: tRNA 2-thiocytidine biosynthesis protein TtcA [Butyricicoccus sp.]|nr:tRNA 2-thiocytidine biosynthesis protein TtcA [Butyricicoccus sp.]